MHAALSLAADAAPGTRLCPTQSLAVYSLVLEMVPFLLPGKDGMSMGLRVTEQGAWDAGSLSCVPSGESGFHSWATKFHMQRDRKFQRETGIIKNTLFGPQPSLPSKQARRRAQAL